MADVEELTQSIGRKLFAQVHKQVRPVVSSHWWYEKAMVWFMKDDELRTRALGLVDVYPVLRTAEEKRQHFKEYLGKDLQSPPVMLRIAGVLVDYLVGRQLVGYATELAVRKISRHFITEATLKEASGRIKSVERKGAFCTLNRLGEATLSETEAEKYMANQIYLIKVLEFPWDRNYSIKFSALYSQFDPVNFKGSIAAVKPRYQSILRTAKETGAFVYTDSEPYQYRDLGQEIFMQTLREEEFRDFENAGTVHQSYLTDSEENLRRIISWAKTRGHPVTLRLVKGAYWDQENILAQQRGWPIPVYTEKWQTDLSFEKNIDIALESYPAIRTAIGSHNIRSIAHTIAKSMVLGLPQDALEIQVLWGMGNPLIKAIPQMSYILQKMGYQIPYPLKIRVYLTIGNLVEGMGYLARRILENTAQNSFLRQSFGLNVPVEKLLSTPQEARG